MRESHLPIADYGVASFKDFQQISTRTVGYLTITSVATQPMIFPKHQHHDDDAIN